MNVVIGGGSGIGEAVTALLPGRTVVADRVGGDVECDLADQSSIDAVTLQVDELDALVVTAGVSPAMADARTIFDVDLAGMARVLSAFDHLGVRERWPSVWRPWPATSATGPRSGSRRWTIH